MSEVHCAIFNNVKPPIKKIPGTTNLTYKMVVSVFGVHVGGKHYFHSAPVPFQSCRDYRGSTGSDARWGDVSFDSQRGVEIVQWAAPKDLVKILYNLCVNGTYVDLQLFLLVVIKIEVPLQRIIANSICLKQNKTIFVRKTFLFL